MRGNTSHRAFPHVRQPASRADCYNARFTEEAVMALFTAEEARSAFRERQPHLEYKRADLAIFGEQLASIEKTGQQHDVFLSYSHMDAEIVLGFVGASIGRGSVLAQDRERLKAG